MKTQMVHSLSPGLAIVYGDSKSKKSWCRLVRATCSDNINNNLLHDVESLRCAEHSKSYLPLAYLQVPSHREIITAVESLAIA